MIEYLHELARRGGLDKVSVTITPSGITYYMNKRGYELSHKYTYTVLGSLYNKDYAVKSELEQMAIDLYKLATERGKGGKDGSDNTTEESTSNQEG